MVQRRFQELIERLYAARRFGVALGLERVERCLAALGHPERTFPVRVHIGGTNGKGSTAAFVESIARAGGRRTGLFTSPHLTRFCERFTVDGAPATPDAVVRAGEAVAHAGADDLTFFEQVTAMGLWLFAEAGVDIAILEVGLGGRLDATNAVRGEVAAVTGVALEHQQYLGDTLEAIAAEKAGIFKPGQRAVVGRAGEPAAVPWLVAAARAAGATAVTTVDAPVPADWALGLGGVHQRDNAACALAIARHLDELGHLDADEATCRAGLAAARLPGRLEIVRQAGPGGPAVVIDGAHNPHAARVLGAAMAEMAAPRVLVLSVSQDKDVAGVARPLVAQADHVVATAYAQERALPAAALAPAIGALGLDATREVVADVAAAIARACERAGPAGTVIVAGSLYLVGEARQALCGAEADPLPLADPMAGP